MIITYRKTVSSVVSFRVISNETFAGLGTSLEGFDLANYTITNTPQVKVDCDENRRVDVDNVDTDGFDVIGGPGGDNPPYNLRIAIKLFE